MSPEAKKRLEAAKGPVTIEFNPSTFKPRKKGHIAKNPDGRIVLINEANSRYLGSDDIANLWARSTGEKKIDEIPTELASPRTFHPFRFRQQVSASIPPYRTIGL